MKKAPFIVVEEYLSPLQCETIVDGLDLTYPQFDIDDNVQPMVVVNRLLESRLADATLKVCDMIDQYYNVEIEAISKHRFIWYPEDYVNNVADSDNSRFIEGEWKRKNSFDFSAIIFLSEYSENEHFDNSYEVYGGKVQYPSFDIAFKPTRGSLIIYPSSENFVYNISEVYAGDLNIIQIFFKCKEPYHYDFTQFENDYRKWDL